jgi:hypothetical protein
MFKKGWGTTSLKLFAITFKCCPYHLLFVGLGASQVIVFVCLSFVSSFWIQAVLTGMIYCNLVPMSPTVIIIGRRKGIGGTAAVALLFEENPDFLQSLRAVFKLFC